MRAAYFSSLVFVIFAFIGCQGTLNPYDGSYTYRAYDQAGKLVVTGVLIFRQMDIDGVKGNWHLRNVNGSGETGIDKSFGAFEGSLKGDTLYLDLNPGWVDRNVILQGILSGERYNGVWAHIGFPGVLREGTFTAFLN